MTLYGLEASPNFTAITTALQSAFSSFTADWTFANIVSMLSIALGVSAGLVLGWFGLRKVVKMVQTALKRGKISV